MFDIEKRLSITFVDKHFLGNAFGKNPNQSYERFEKPLACHQNATFTKQMNGPIVFTQRHVILIIVVIISPSKETVQLWFLKLEK